MNAALAPLTTAWLGLPAALGVPLLFGVLRKELSLLMLFQALGTQDVGAVLDATQLMTLLLFVTFYVPCLSTLAVMVRALGSRQALQSAGISLVVALGLAGAGRVTMVLATGIA
jgi:ferrous iron transport protein B